MSIEQTDIDKLKTLFKQGQHLEYLRGYSKALLDLTKMLQHVSEGKGDYKLTANEVAGLVRIAVDTLPKEDQLEKELAEIKI